MPPREEPRTARSRMLTSGGVRAAEKRGPNVTRRASNVELKNVTTKSLIVAILITLAVPAPDAQVTTSVISKYPRLAEVAAWRKETLIGHDRGNAAGAQFDGKRHGGFYTQDDVREIVAYAADRFITVIPEIEMPGHSQAIVAVCTAGSQCRPSSNRSFRHASSASRANSGPSTCLARKRSSSWRFPG